MVCMVCTHDFGVFLKLIQCLKTPLFTIGKMSCTVMRSLDEKKKREVYNVTYAIRTLVCLLTGDVAQ